MSDVNLQKPALSGAGKSSRLFDRGDLIRFGAMIVVLSAFVGLSENPTVDEYVVGQWAGKCAAYDGHLGTVSDFEIGGYYATVSRLDGTARERIALSKLSRVDCPVAAAPQAVATVVPDTVDVLSERQRVIVRLTSDIEIMKLKIEIARLAKEYREVVAGEEAEGGNDIRSQDTAGAEIIDNKRRIDRLMMELQRSKAAMDYYNRLDQFPGADISR